MTNVNLCRVVWSPEKRYDCDPYEQARQQDDSLEGVMWLNMTLSNDGRIRGVVVEGRSTLKSETMRKCMEKKLFSLKMPKPSGGAVTFSAPFQFAPSGP